MKTKSKNYFVLNGLVFKKVQEFANLWLDEEEKANMSNEKKTILEQVIDKCLKSKEVSSLIEKIYALDKQQERMLDELKGWQRYFINKKTLMFEMLFSFEQDQITFGRLYAWDIVDTLCGYDAEYKDSKYYKAQFNYIENYFNLLNGKQNKIENEQDLKNLYDVAISPLKVMHREEKLLDSIGINLQKEINHDAFFKSCVDIFNDSSLDIILRAIICEILIEKYNFFEFGNGIFGKLVASILLSKGLSPYSSLLLANSKITAELENENSRDLMIDTDLFSCVVKALKDYCSMIEKIIMLLGEVKEFFFNENNIINSYQFSNEETKNALIYIVEEGEYFSLEELAEEINLNIKDTKKILKELVEKDLVIQEYNSNIRGTMYFPNEDIFEKTFYFKNYNRAAF